MIVVDFGSGYEGIVKIVLDSSNFEFGWWESDGSDFTVRNIDDEMMPIWIKEWDVDKAVVLMWASGVGVVSYWMKHGVYVGEPSLAVSTNLWDCKFSGEIQNVSEVSVVSVASDLTSVVKPVFGNEGIKLTSSRELFLCSRPVEMKIFVLSFDFVSVQWQDYSPYSSFSLNYTKIEDYFGGSDKTWDPGYYAVVASGQWAVPKQVTITFGAPGWVRSQPFSTLTLDVNGEVTDLLVGGGWFLSPWSDFNVNGDILGVFSYRGTVTINATGGMELVADTVKLFSDIFDDSGVYWFEMPVSSKIGFRPAYDGYNVEIPYNDEGNKYEWSQPHFDIGGKLYSLTKEEYDSRVLPTARYYAYDVLKIDDEFWVEYTDRFVVHFYGNVLESEQFDVGELKLVAGGGTLQLYVGGLLRDEIIWNGSVTFSECVIGGSDIELRSLSLTGGNVGGLSATIVPDKLCGSVNELDDDCPISGVVRLRGLTD